MEAQTWKKKSVSKGGGPKGGGPKISRFFFPVPPQNSFFFSLSGGLLVAFWWCLKRRGPEMCTFGVLGLSCASPGGPVWWFRWGFTRQPESPNVHISGFRPSKTPTKFNERTPRERKKNENCGGRREKKERNFWAVRRRAVRRRAVQRRAVRRRAVQRRAVRRRAVTTRTTPHQHHINTTPTPHRFTTAHKIDDNMDRSHGFATHTRRQQKVHVRLRPISTSANFDFGQFRLRPISTSANFDFGQFDFGQLAEIELAEVEIGRSRASSITSRQRSLCEAPVDCAAT